MSFDLSNKNHKNLDALLSKILDWHKEGAITKNEAIGVLAHILTAAAIDNESEVISWLEKPEVLERWKEYSDMHR